MHPFAELHILSDALAATLSGYGRLFARSAFLTAEETDSTERTLAGVRVFFSSVALVAIYLDPTEPLRYSGFAHAMLAGYVVSSLCVAIWIHLRRGVSPAGAMSIHAVDVLATSMLTLFTEGPTSPLFVFFGFALLAAAYRWGLRETLWTGVICVLLFGTEAVLVSSVGIEGQFELNRFLIRCTYLLLLAVMVGHVAEEEKRRQGEGTALAGAIARAQQFGTLRATLQCVAGDVAVLFGSRELCLVLEEGETGRLFLWEYSRPTDGEEPAVRLTELDGPARDAYVMPAALGDCILTRRPGSQQCEVHIAEGARRGLKRLPVVPSVALLGAQRFERALSVSHSFGDEWRGRLFVFDPDLSRGARRGLRALAAIFTQLGGVVHNTYLVGRLRTRAGAVARAQVAHEIHDGIIQSLIGLKMKVEALRVATPPSEKLRLELAAIEELLRTDVENLRVLMFELTPAHVEPRHLPVALGDVVERFRRATGIAARFVCEADEVDGSPRKCREVARILQEALVNVQKHSGAQNVLVHFRVNVSSWTLIVDDDGHGYDFHGKFSNESLDRMRRGPSVIKERLRTIGGSLEIDSTPGVGSRLEITVPRMGPP